MTQSSPSKPAASVEEKAQHILDSLDLEERVRVRKTPNLLVVMAPFWVWLGGLIWLPEATPGFVRWAFNLTCWGCFVFLLYQTVQAVRAERAMSDFKEKSSRREELEALAAKHRERQKNQSNP
jgi:hypothetical protein